jgi:hypothetical protein
MTNVLKWKFGKFFENINERFTKRKDAYDIMHVSNGNHITVGIYERDDYFRCFLNYKRDDDRPWWTPDMGDTTEISLFPPTQEELSEGITYETKINAAYSALQPLLKGLNEERVIKQKLARELENVARNVNVKQD